MTKLHCTMRAAKVASCLAILSLAACSPYQFSKEVADFNTGFDHVSAAFAGGYANLAVDRVAAQQRQMMDARSKVTLARSCERFASENPKPCLLFARGLPEPTLSEAELIQPDTTEKMKALGAYVRSLHAVTNAADRTAFNDAAKRLGTSVGRLAAAAGPMAAGADQIAPAVINVVFWVVGQALDRDRFDALRDGVTKAAGPVRTIATGLGTGLQAISSARREILGTEADELAFRLGPRLTDAAYRDRLARATAVVARLDEVRQTDPAIVTGKLIKAHDTLVAAVNNPDPNYAEIVKTIDEFVTAAKGVYQALAAAK